MTNIPQRTLRNVGSAILRRAEAGPIRAQSWAKSDSVRELLSTPTDPTLAGDLRQADLEPPVEPWIR